MSCGVGHRRGSDLVLLWLWHRPVAAALIGPLAWEPPYATGAALKSKKRKKEKNENQVDYNGKCNFKRYYLRSSHCGSVVNESN